MSLGLLVFFLGATLWTCSFYFHSALSTPFHEVFHEADLTFVSVPACSNSMILDKIEVRHFHTIQNVNLYTPLRYYVLCYTGSGLLFPQVLVNIDWNLNKDKCSRPVVVFIRSDRSVGQTSDGYSACEDLIYYNYRVFRPYVIFSLTLHRRDLECYARAAELIGLAKLVVLEDSVKSPRYFLPCLTCKPIKYLRLRGISLFNVRKAWDIINKNMHEYYIYYLKTQKFVRRGRCGLLPSKLGEIDEFNFCLIKTISIKYNLTMMQVSSRSRHVDLSLERVMGIRDDLPNSAKDEVYEVQFGYINFLTITNPPSPASGVTTFVSPFDTESWTFLLISVIFVATYFAWLEQDGIIRCDLQTFVSMAEKVITVTSMFLGQVGETTRKAYCKAKVALILVILWLFGYFILTANLYQGSIYSCLAVLFPPQTPQGFNDLAKGNIQIEKISPIGNGSIFLTLKKYSHENFTGIAPTVAAESPFRVTEFRVGFKNLIFAYVAKEWGRLHESGLGGMWEKMVRIGSALNKTEFRHGEQKYFEMVQIYLGKVKGKIRFHESTPVSLELIWPVFLICGVTFLLSGIVFVTENKFVIIWPALWMKTKFIYLGKLWK
ncbi:hypothetical protein Fcan01_28490 [Folsomia candida]|uniref:Uncharacterized protein n=1 Tax=Folsomia candida TaxID=158441 RepID=A0A226CW47_FOLCA|nr:hypothetical protein Fcan01_28490 [Folsomia candida]